MKTVSVDNWKRETMSNENEPSTDGQKGIKKDLT